MDRGRERKETTRELSFDVLGGLANFQATGTGTTALGDEDPSLIDSHLRPARSQPFYETYALGEERLASGASGWQLDSSET